MALPATWNATTLAVDPWVLHSAAQNSIDAVKNINTVLSAVTTRLNELRLSWTGDSQDQADKFNQEWNAMVTQLFGTEDHPENGILNRFCAGLEAAAVGYSRGERAVSDSFAMFQGLMAGMDPADLTGKGDADLSDIVATYHTPAPDAPDRDPLLDNPPAENVVTDDPSEEEQKDNIHHTSVNQTF
ncbi:hypothetical protein RVR_2475 [Actinacidiphila reveromycinica]|uniref:WXG100 family type VII secretion target n=1 Tax=Actinacidiphila reveromycinica TaxID=659352 RepID=A0A7U3VMT9_9ACTN|nr:hypothetical protein [Streptomyces sp. SN-593]BBA96942.1 hypothetical protein RVR_2475 [Streptomyces sp. SN-593]